MTRHVLPLALTLAAVAFAARAEPSRGEYLVGIAGCGDCHTSRESGGAKLGGGKLDFAPITPGGPWASFAPRLAGGPADYPQKDLEHLLMTGQRPDGSAPRPPMPAFHMTAEDAHAVAVYLYGLK